MRKDRIISGFVLFTLVLFTAQLVSSTPDTPIILSMPRAVNYSTVNFIGYINASDINVTINTTSAGQLHQNWSFNYTSGKLINTTTVSSQFALNSILIPNDNGTMLYNGSNIMFSSHNRSYLRLYNVTSVEFLGSNPDRINISPDLEQTVSPGDTIFIYSTTNNSYPPGWFNISSYLYEGSNTIKIQGLDTSGTSGPILTTSIFYDTIHPTILAYFPNITNSENKIIKFNISDNFELNLSSLEVNVTCSKYSALYNLSNATCTSPTINFSNCSLSADLSNSTYNITFTIKDLASNINRSTFNVSVIYDPTVPNILLSIPNKTTTRTSLLFFNMSDNLQLDLSTFQLNISSGSTTTFNLSNVSCTSLQTNFSNCSINVSLTNGLYNISFEVKDIASNINISYKLNYNVSVPDTAPTISSIYTNRTIIIGGSNFTLFADNIVTSNNNVVHFVCSNSSNPNLNNSLCLSNASGSDYTSLNCTITSLDATINTTYFCAVNYSSYTSNIVNISIQTDNSAPNIITGLGTGESDTSVNVMFNVSDNFQLNLNTLTLNITNGSTSYYYDINSINCTSLNINFSNCSVHATLPASNYNLTFRLNDTADNQNITIVGYWIDLKPPAMLWLNDTGDYTNNASLVATWMGEDNESQIEYEYAVGNDTYPNEGWNSKKTWTSAGTNTSVTATGLSLDNYITYYFSVRAKDKGGTYSNIISSDGITINDQSNPIITMIMDEGNFSGSNSSLFFRWTATDPESGIDYYEYSLGNDTYANSLTDWNNIINSSYTTATNVTITGLELSTNDTYYFTVVAFNGAGGDSRNSTDGITIDPTPPTNGNISYPTIKTDRIAKINLSKGMDSISGIKEDILYIRNATLIGGNCIGWTEWYASNYTNITTNEINFSTTSGYCYMFNYSVENWARLFTYYPNSTYEMKVDYTVPSTPTITDKGTVTTIAVINATFSSTDADTNISYYQYAIGNRSYPNDGWDKYLSLTNLSKLTASSANISVTNISFIDDAIYYITARAVNTFKNRSEYASSNGILYNDITPPSTFLVSVNNITNSSQGYYFRTNSPINITIEGETGMHCKHYPIDTIYLTEWGTNCTTVGNRSNCNVTPSVSGTNHVHISCTDYANLPNKQNKTNNIDVTWISNWLLPNITHLYPTTNSVVTAGDITINISTLENATCKMFEGSDEYDMNDSGQTHSYPKTVTTGSTYALSFNCTDSLNDSAASTLSFTVWESLLNIVSLTFDRNILYSNQNITIMPELSMANNISLIIVNVTAPDNSSYKLTASNFTNISAPATNTYITTNFTFTNVTGTYNVSFYINDTSNLNAIKTATFKVFTNISHSIEINSTERIKVNYLNPSDDTTISNYTYLSKTTTMLPDTLLSVELSPPNNSVRLKIPGINLSTIKTVNATARNISYNTISNSTLSIGQNTTSRYIIKNGYVFELVNASSFNRDIMVMFNYSALGISSPSSIKIFKTGYNVSNESFDFSGSFITTYSDSNFAWVNVTSFSLFLLTQDRCLDGTKNGDETGTDCGGSCSACTSGGTPGGGGGGGGSSGGAGGGGGGGGGSSVEVSNILNSYSHLWDIVNAGNTLTLDVRKPNISIRKVEVEVKYALANVKLTVATLKSNPTYNNIEIPYQYLDLTGSGINNIDISKISIGFRIEKSWFEKNSLLKNDISLFLYSNGEWKNLTTKHVKSDERYLYYESKGYMLGHYAVGSNKVTLKTEQQAPKEETVKETISEPAPAKTPPQLSPPEEKSSMTWSYIIITLLLALILAPSLIVVKSKRTKSKTLKDLKNYIKNRLAEGMSTKDIARILLETGWDEKIVNDNITETYGEIGLSSYIESCLSQGLSKTRIKAELLKKGWSKRSLEPYFSRKKKLK